MQNAVLVKNIEQKGNIQSLNNYHNKKETGIIIVGESPEQKNKIIYTNKVLNNIIQYTSAEINGQNFYFMLPKVT